MLNRLTRRFKVLSPQFRRFWLARTLSIIGDQMALVALVTYAYRDSHAATFASLVMLAFTVPRLLGPVAGAVADGVEARRTMVVLDLAQGAVALGLLVLVGHQVALVAGAFLLTLLATLYLPTGRRSIARLAPGEAARHAYAAIGTSWNIGWAVGPALGGALVALGGPRLALGVDVATFLASALLLRGLPPLPPAAGINTQRSRIRAVTASMRRGVSFLLRNPRPRALAVNLLLVVSIASIDTVALVALTGDVLHTGPGGYGVLLSASGIGMLCGSVLVSGLGWLSTRNLLFGGQTVLALGALGTGLAPNQFAATAAQWTAGLGNGLENVASDVTMQESVPDEILGTVTGVLLTVPYLGNLIAYSAAPFVVRGIGPELALICSGAGIFLAAAALRLVMRERTAPPASADDLALAGESPHER